MKQKELKEILESHKLWLLDNTKGKRADLRGADLTRANLVGANLRCADLRGADLTSANLSGANSVNVDLSDASLHRANLVGTNLVNVDLSDVNLSGADLRDANLSFADLSGANLSDAYLNRANLTHCKGLISFTAGKHLAFFTPHNRYLKIGCEGHNLDYWLENYETIAESDNWDNKSINDYGGFIKMLNEREGL